MSNVIQLGDMRITRARRSYIRAKDECQHLHLTADDEGQIVECDDCKKQVSAYWALNMLASRYADEMAKVDAGARRLAEAKEKDLSLIAAQRVEKAWRSRSMVPTCPHCREPVFAQDGFGCSLTNREIAVRRREVQAATHPDGGKGEGR